MLKDQADNMAEAYFIGIDVGTGSVRAALIDNDGKMLKTSSRNITTWNPNPGFYEQSSDDIWNSCCHVVKDVVKNAAVDVRKIKGIGFDATCSLVAIGKNGSPVTVSPTGKQEQNVILWMDHRAVEETNFINSHRPQVLDSTGGTISLEMETPKLMWLKKNLPGSWKAVEYFFDLSDFLTWKATGDDSRSLCTTVCKWTFRANEKEFKGWDETYFSLIKLQDLLDDGAVKIGKTIKFPGEKAGNGLTLDAARDFGLLGGTAVGIALIDAHAGGLGMMGCSASKDIPSSFNSRIAMISGTSTCHMVVTEKPLKVPGVWGPYYAAMIPGLWLNEAGQSATGKFLDFLIETHPAFQKIQQTLGENGQIQVYLNSILGQLQTKCSSLAELTADVHIWPDFHGNRSPLADPTLKGMISGLSLVRDEEDLAIKYLAAVQALAYGTRHIMDTMKDYGHANFRSVLVCGGLSKNKLFVQTHADVLGLPVLLPKNSESVLLGSAMLGAVASGYYSNLKEAVERMAGSAHVFLPNRADERYHSRKYKVFLKMVQDQRDYKRIMQEN